MAETNTTAPGSALSCIRQMPQENKKQAGSSVIILRKNALKGFKIVFRCLLSEPRSSFVKKNDYIVVDVFASVFAFFFLIWRLVWDNESFGGEPQMMRGIS